ncbi:hypothetical protein FKP32DRAFT_1615668 [Trametes sanguinea]|nr:hypothetical protein FKP32DRAFT_1615668 [Trametes sanguinea]
MSLAAVSKGWRSSVHKHFQAPHIVAGPNGSSIYQFVCKKHPFKHVNRMDYEDSTSNLKCHVDACDLDETPEAELLTAYASGIAYSPGRLRVLIALWCSHRHRPFALVEDPEFIQILRMMYMKHSKTNLVKLLSEIPGKIHICVNGWTSPNVLTFLGVTAHWHHNNEMSTLSSTL